MQFGLMPERVTIDVFILRMLHREYHAKGKKLYMCFVDLEKAFDREECVGNGNEEERNTRSFGLISDEGTKSE